MRRGSAAALPPPAERPHKDVRAGVPRTDACLPLAGEAPLRLGHQVVLLPAHDVRPYVRRNKTDRTDAAGLLEADRCGDIRPVPIKSPDAQGVQALHRIREQLKAQRTALVNLIRGLLRDFGLVIASGAERVRPATLAALEDGDNDLPMSLRHGLHHLLEQIALCERGMQGIEQELDAFARRDRRSQLYLQAGGVGLLTATALSASVGELARFDSGRHLASALGLPPSEHSSGNTRRLGAHHQTRRQRPAHPADSRRTVCAAGGEARPETGKTA